MELSFYEKLNPVQKNYARYIAEQAREVGVPPDLAVAIAFKESGLNPSVKAGGAGEIGIMQIKPATAKEMGFSEEDIKDPKRNIDAGLKYLKKSLDMSEGDPRLAAAGYNAGVNHPFFYSKDSALPDTTINYLKDLKGYGAFTQVPKPVAPEDRPVTPEEAQMATEESQKGIAGAMGAGAGALLSGARLKTGRPEFPFKSPEVPGQVDRGAPFRPATAPTAPPGAPTTHAGGPMAPMGAPGAPTGMPTPPGAPAGYGKATGPGSATFNYARSFGLPEIEAGRALGVGKEAGEVWDLLGKRQEALTGIQQKFPTETYVENPRYGGLMTPAEGPGAGPKASFVQQPGGALQSLPPKAPISTTPPPRGALEEVAQIFKNMMGPVTRATEKIPPGVRAAGSKAFGYLSPPLLGYQIGSELAGAYGESEKEQPDYTKMGLGALGALGAAASLYPPLAPIGLPLAVGAPAIQSYRERMQGAEPVTTEIVAP